MHSEAASSAYGAVGLELELFHGFGGLACCIPFGILSLDVCLACGHALDYYVMVGHTIYNSWPALGDVDDVIVTVYKAIGTEVGKWENLVGSW